MGYYYCKPKPYDAHTSNVVLFLAVALVLLVIPWLFAREPVVEVEEKMNLAPLITPILVLIILLLISSMGSSKKPHHHCRCKHACYCYGYYKYY